MWAIDTVWFDVAMVGTGMAVGNILFGRFEEHRPRARRLLKLALIMAITLVLARTVGRAWAYGWMLLPAALAVWVHAVWLPRPGGERMDGGAARPLL